MTDLEKLIQAKTDRLETIPDELLSRIEKNQKALLPKVIELLNKLDRSPDGKILLNNTNLQFTADIDSLLRQVLLESEYPQAVRDFANQFEVQKVITDTLLSDEFPEYSASATASGLIELSRRKAVDSFMRGIADDAFVYAIRDQVELAMANNAGWAETVSLIQTIVTGDGELDSKIMQYSKQVAHDQFAVSDRSYTSAVADENGYEWFKYSGSAIRSTREFCRERHNMFFHRKEIEAWGDNKRTESPSGGLFKYPTSKGWPGRNSATTESTIFSLAGGWNCRHSIIPTSIFRVPKSAILRAMDQGYFEPSRFERERLDL